MFWRIKVITCFKTYQKKEVQVDKVKIKIEIEFTPSCIIAAAQAALILSSILV